MSLLKLTYTRKKDRFQGVTVIGDPEGIRDLYWQLTHNYKAQDGAEIGSVTIYDLDGIDVTSNVRTNPHSYASRLSSLES